MVAATRGHGRRFVVRPGRRVHCGRGDASPRPAGGTAACERHARARRLPPGCARACPDVVPSPDRAARLRAQLPRSWGGGVRRPAEARVDAAVVSSRRPPPGAVNENALACSTAPRRCSSWPTGSYSAHGLAGERRARRLSACDARAWRGGWGLDEVHRSRRRREIARGIARRTDLPGRPRRACPRWIRRYRPWLVQGGDCRVYRLRGVDDDPPPLSPATTPIGASVSRHRPAARPTTPRG